jgi:hypothetical protein
MIDTLEFGISFSTSTANGKFMVTTDLLLAARLTGEELSIPAESWSTRRHEKRSNNEP